MNENPTLVCPGCSTPQSKSSLPIIEKWKNYFIYECTHCQLQFADPVTYPSSEYEGSLPYAHIEWQNKLFFKMVPIRKGTLLDIGCNSGYLTMLMKKFGFDVYGIEINPQGVQHAKKVYGLKNIFQCTLADLEKNIPNKMQFDVITLFEVLEHLPDCGKTIDLVHKQYLKPGGYLCLSVPNRDRFFKSTWWDYSGVETDYPPNHQTRWSKKVLKNFLENHGFTVETIITKTLAGDELARPILDRLGFNLISCLNRMLSKSKNTQNSSTGESAPQGPILTKTQYQTSLLKLAASIKRGTILSAMSVVAVLLRLIGAQGFGIFCIAKK